MASFGAIRPAPAKDFFKFDLTQEIGSTGAIQNVVWTCTVAPESTVADSTPAARIIGVPIFDNYTTAALCGDMIEGVIYTLTVEATINDTRILLDSGDVECALRPDIVISVLSIEQFRAEFPTFSDPTKYPDTQIGFWINQVVNFSPLNKERWGQFFDLGLRLYIAHNLALEYQAGQASGAPIGAGVPSSKSVGGVSISYDVEFGSEEDGGAWNLTVYGSRFIRLLRQAGAGPLQL